MLLIIKHKNGSKPALINNTKTYEAKAYVEAKDKSISPEATKNTSGITINKRVGIMTKTD